MSVSVAPQHQPTTHPYTCLACALAFTTAQTQRTHYSTDLHRYNSKRAVAGLSPIDLNTFNQKFAQNLNKPIPLKSDSHLLFRCHPCRKSFSTQNAYNNHLISKKHEHQTILNQNDQATKPVPIQQKLSNSNGASSFTHDSHLESSPRTDCPPTHLNINQMHLDPTPSSIIPPETKPTEEGSLLDRLIQLRIDQAPEIGLHECLFCPRSKNPTQYHDVDHVLKHMLIEHGFFLPDQEFLVDKTGLLKYLAQTISVWNVCIYCGAGFGGKMQDDQDDTDFASATRNGLNSVRKHMCDKNHCKLAWNTEEDRLEYSDFFDYRPSYKNNNLNGVKKAKSKSIAARISIRRGEDEDSEWEDEDQSMKSDDESIAEEERTASFGDSLFELVLPNGVRLGHRSLRHIYKQNLLPYAVGSQSTQAGNRNINLITRLAILSNQYSPLKNVDNPPVLLNKLGGSKSSSSSLTKSALIPARGGGINFNLPQAEYHPQVIKVKDAGQAEFAGHHIRTFKDTHKKLQFQNRVSCKSGNNQKHYRDPLLQ